MKKKQKENDQSKKDELERCKQDPVYFATHYVKVKDSRTGKTRKLTFVELNCIQRMMDYTNNMYKRH